jgi:hypothetical protein
MAVLPTPTLDHVVVNVRDQIEAGFATYRRLGFTLTPRGYHTLGSVNHLAIFGTDYLELIAAPPGETRRAEILDAPAGLNGLVFGTEDSASVQAALRSSGIPAEPPNEFSRPVELPGGDRRNAVFRTVRLEQQHIPGARLYFCHHLTRDLVWRDVWRRHPNGAIGVARAVIAADAPQEIGDLFARMFGHQAVRRGPEGCTLLVGLSNFEVMTRPALERTFGTAAPDGDGRPAFMAALTLRTRSLQQAGAVLSAAGVKHAGSERGTLVVAASEAFGVTLEFCA